MKNTSTRIPQHEQALENYENGVLTKPKEVSPWWLRYSLVLFEEQQVRPSCYRSWGLYSGAMAGLDWMVVGLTGWLTS